MTVDTMGRKGRGMNQWMVRRIKMISSRKAHRMWGRGKTLSTEERFRKPLGDVLSDKVTVLQRRTNRQNLLFSFGKEKKT